MSIKSKIHQVCAKVFQASAVRTVNDTLTNITHERQRQALRTTAAFVDQHMAHVSSVNTDLAVMDRAIARAKINPGDLVLEFGVFKGRSITHLANRLGATHTIYGFDSFEGLPEFWRDGYEAGAFKVDALPTVPANVKLIRGWFDKTLPGFLQDHQAPVALVHVDCDLYSSTKTVFDLVGPRFKEDCVIVFDEYFNYPGWEVAEHKAFMEFILQTGFRYEFITYNSVHEQVAVQLKGRA